ncbi:MAG: GDSL-type esterase/lipase family protein [Vicinamibacterales bacterium]|nr:GDSL-type esterase/lipase family protein [Vicinamibacterales bacterium]
MSLPRTATGIGMSTDQPHRATFWQRVLLVCLSPVIFLAVSEIALRMGSADTDLSRNENFEIAVPTWLLADDNWVDIQRERLESPRGVRAEDVSWLNFFEEARWIQYKLKPGLSAHANNPFNDIELAKNVTFGLRSNSSGFRTREFHARTPDLNRIVTLGDSSTFGWGVDAHYTYQALLESRLRADGEATEILNLGIPGFTSRHGRGVMDHYGLALDPDLFILSFGANDGRYVLRPIDDVLALDDTWRGTARAVLLRFASFRLLRRAIFTWFDPFERSRENAADGSPRQLVRAVSRDAYIENLRTLIAQARSNGGDAALLSVCAPQEYANAMREVAQSEDVPMVDALELFRASLDDLRSHRLYPHEVSFYEDLYGLEAMEANWRYYVTTDGCHPGRAGHSLIADALADAIGRARNLRIDQALLSLATGRDRTHR